MAEGIYFMVAQDESDRDPATDEGALVSDSLLNDRTLIDLVNARPDDFPLVIRFFGYVTDFVEPDLVPGFEDELRTLRARVNHESAALNDLDLLISMCGAARTSSLGIQVHGP
jgi:hypothetical protein